MQLLRTVALPFYLTAVVIIFFPALELALTLWPWSPGVLSWRFGAVGLLTRAIMTPMVGLALLFGTAVASEHKLLLRLVAVFGLLGGSTLLLVMGMFSLDWFDFRGSVQPEASLAFNTSSAVALLKLLAGSTVLFAFGGKALRAVRDAKKAARRDPTTVMAFRSRPVKGDETGAEGNT